MKKGSDSETGMKAVEILLVVLSLAFLIGHGIYAARVNSVTADEYVHLPVGISILQTGDFRMDHGGSPPLRAVAALPALAQNPVMDYSSQFWNRHKVYQFSWLFLRNNFDGYHQLYFLPRLMTVGFAILLGLFVFMAARNIHGSGAAALALFMFCFNPEILAHSPLVTSDLLAGCFFLPLFYFSSDFSKRPAR